MPSTAISFRRFSSPFFAYDIQTQCTDRADLSMTTIKSLKDLIAKSNPVSLLGEMHSLARAARLKHWEYVKNIGASHEDCFNYFPPVSALPTTLIDIGANTALRPVADYGFRN